MCDEIDLVAFKFSLDVGSSTDTCFGDAGHSNADRLL
jgi:hypothetical protein